MKRYSDGRLQGTLEERLEDRIWAKPGCWEWLGSHFKTTGYGLFHRPDPAGVWRSTVAHRVVYEVFVGPIPEGLEIDHLCRNRRCVNPNHLEPVTHRENGLRGESIFAKEARQTHCIHGHPFSGDNLRYKPDGRRRCMTCERAWDAKRGWRR